MHTQTTLIYLLLLLLLGASAPAFAAVTAINQTKAINGNVTPGDAAGFPVTLSRRGSYRLDGNLTVPNENITAINVTANNVSIDLNGFAILGPTVCTGSPVTSCSRPTGSGNGVNAPSRTGTVVINGQVRGLGNIGLNLGTDSRVEGVTALSNGNIGIVATFGNTVTGNTTNFNRSVGISASGAISENTANSNGGIGIDANASTVTGNTANSNGVGISGFGSTVIGNTVNFNQVFGISANGAVLDNQASNNTGAGLRLDSTTGYARNVLNFNNGGNANPQVLNGINLGQNVCGGDTVCP